MRRIVKVGAAVIALIIAGIVVGTAPDNERIVAPLYIFGRVGDVVEARLLSVQINEVVVAHQIDVTYRTDMAPTPSTGVWVVIDATVTPALGSVALDSTELRVGDARYRVSPVVPAPTLQANSYGAGVPLHGQLAFEIPSSALHNPSATRAELVFTRNFEPKLDTVPVIMIDLSTVNVDRSARITPVTVVDRP